MQLINLDELKEIELNMLIKFDKFCEDNNLKYYLCGGTLLGAVRHKGFIPWDDDIDIIMLRDDYEKMISLLLDNPLNDYLEIRTSRNDSTVQPFSKIVDTRTQIEEEYLQNRSVSHIWIDVFPVDGLPDDENQIKRIYKKIDFYRKLLVISTAKLGKGKTKFRAAIKILLTPIVKIIGAKRIRDKIENIAKRNKVEASKYIGCIVWGNGAKECVPYKVFNESIKLEFEGHFLSVPKYYDIYLSSIYGDYMKLPPEDKRVTHEFKAWWKENY